MLELLYHTRTRYRLFTITRHPAARFRSAWRDKIAPLSGAELDPFDEGPMVVDQKRVVQQVAALRGCHFEDVSGITPLEFCVSLERCQLRQANVHWRPQVFIMNRQLLRYDEVFRLEDVAASRAQLEDALGVGEAFDLHLNHTLEAPDLDAETLARVQAIYAHDYRVLGY